MDELDLPGTRRALHAVAEFVLAGPQYAASSSIRLRITPGGFGTCAAPEIRVEGTDLVTPAGRHRLFGSCRDLGGVIGVGTRDLRDVYAVGPDLAVDESFVLDPAAADVIANAFQRGDETLRAFAPGQDPVLWPEHFDLGITVEEVNYGVSPGDAGSDVPYAYIGPWVPREGEFWNTAFGAARPMSELADAEALLRFFGEGAERASSDPPAPAR